MTTVQGLPKSTTGTGKGRQKLRPKAKTEVTPQGKATRENARADSKPTVRGDSFTRTTDPVASLPAVTSKARSAAKALHLTLDEGQQVKLRPVSRKNLERVIEGMKTLQFEGPRHKLYPMPWNLLWNDNCLKRASAMAHALNRGGQLKVIPFHPRKSYLEELTQNPKIDVLRIDLTGQASGKQKYVQPDGTVLPYETYYSWTVHRAVAVNLEGELAVVDLAVSDRPMSIEEWALHFFKKLPASGIPQIDKDEASLVDRYLNGLAVERKPRSLIAFSLAPTFAPESSVCPSPDGSVRDESGVAYDLLYDLQTTRDRMADDENLHLTFKEIVNLKVVNRITSG